MHRHLPATPEALLKAIAPSRGPIVLAAACMFPWDWRAALWAEHGMPVVLAHALSRQALHGGKATHDKRDAHTMALRLRGGMLPHASVSPAERRAPRDLRRRRRPLARTRGALLAPVPTPNSPSPLPAIGPTIASPTNRAGVAARWADPAVHKRLDVARASPPTMRCDATSHAPASQRPRTMTPRRGLCGPRCLAAARSSVSCSSTTAISSTVARGGRRAPPVAVGSRVPRQRRGHVPAPPAPQSAMRLARGLSLQRPSSASGIIRQDKHSSHAWRTNMGKARP